MTIHLRKSAAAAISIPHQETEPRTLSDVPFLKEKVKQNARMKDLRIARLLCTSFLTDSYAQLAMIGCFTLVCLLALAHFVQTEFLTQRENNNPLRYREMKKVYANEVPIYEGILRQEHTWTTSSHSTIPNYEKTLVVMTHREFLFGCFSLETYLSPKFHTLYIFDEETIKGLNIDALVRGATRETSAGAHLFYSDGLAGIEYSRNVGQQFAGFLEENGYPLEYLLVTECNSNPLPEQHKMHVPMDEIILKMARDFTKSKESRSKGQFLEGNYDKNGYIRLNTHDIELKKQQSKMDILAMNTVLWEKVPNLEEVASFHGSDFGKWLDYGGHKPQHLVQESLPWLWDASTFYEGHTALYDLNLLRKLYKLSPLFMSESYNNFEDYFSFPVVANIFNMTVIRNNDINLHLSFYPKGRFDSHVDMDWLKGKSFEMLGMTLSPRFDFNQQILPYIAHGFITWNMIYPWKIAVCKKWDAQEVLPRNGDIMELPISDFNLKRVLEGTLMFFGYRKKSENVLSGKSLSYELDAGFPGSRLLQLKAGLEESTDEWTRILTLQSNEQLWTLYMCRHDNPICNLPMRLKLAPTEKKLEIPAQNATIIDFYFAECMEDEDCCWEKGFAQPMQYGGVTADIRAEFVNTFLADLEPFSGKSQEILKSFMDATVV